jgi:hypothetical protein
VDLECGGKATALSLHSIQYVEARFPPDFHAFSTQGHDDLIGGFRLHCARNHHEGDAMQTTAYPTYTYQEVFEASEK